MSFIRIWIQFNDSIPIFIVFSVVNDVAVVAVVVVVGVGVALVHVITKIINIYSISNPIC